MKEYIELKESIKRLRLDIHTQTNQLKVQHDPIAFVMKLSRESKMYPKSNPDVMVKIFKADGIDVEVNLVSIRKGKKQKTYIIDKIIADNGLFAHLETKKIATKNKIKECKASLKKQEKAFEKMPNPFEIQYKFEIDCLKEALKSASSPVHKDKITQLVNDFMQGQMVSRKGLYDAWFLGARKYVCSLVVKLGGERTFKSEKTAVGSVYYSLPNQQKIRITDHELPDTEQRSYHRSIGISGDWIEIILKKMVSFNELKQHSLTLIQDNLEGLKIYKNETALINEQINALLTKR